MRNGQTASWDQLLDPWDSTARMMMALLRVLTDKGLIGEEEIQVLAAHACQELVSEKEARKHWHTPVLTTAELARMADVSPGMLVLDVGAGFGGPARELVEEFGVRVIGIDRDPLRVLHAIRETRKQGLSDRAQFCWGDFQALPFPDGLFDLVWAMESLTRYDTKWREDVPMGLDPDVFTEFAC